MKGERRRTSLLGQEDRAVVLALPAVEELNELGKELERYAKDQGEAG